MWVTVIANVTGDLEKIIKGLEKELEELEINRRNEAIQTTTL